MNLDSNIKISPFLIIVGLLAYFKLSPIIGSVAIGLGVFLYFLEAKYKPGEIEKLITDKHSKFVYGTAAILSLIFAYILFNEGDLAFVPIMIYLAYTQFKKLKKNRKENT
jgi:hypothetical protein